MLILVYDRAYRIGIRTDGDKLSKEIHAFIELFRMAKYQSGRNGGSSTY